MKGEEKSVEPHRGQWKRGSMEHNGDEDAQPRLPQWNEMDLLGSNLTRTTSFSLNDGSRPGVPSQDQAAGPRAGIGAQSLDFRDVHTWSQSH